MPLLLPRGLLWQSLWLSSVSKLHSHPSPTHSSLQLCFLPPKGTRVGIGRRPPYGTQRGWEWEGPCGASGVLVLQECTAVTKHLPGPSAPQFLSSSHITLRPLVNPVCSTSLLFFTLLPLAPSTVALCLSSADNDFDFSPP